MFENAATNKMTASIFLQDAVSA